MFQLNLYALIYDIIAYLVAARSLVDEILYKLGYKRKIDVKKDLPSDLTGHVALVTGGTRGLGLTVVKTLVSKGCKVFVASSQTKDKFPQILQRIYDQIPELDRTTQVPRGDVKLHHLDLTSMNSVVQFIQAFKKADFGSGLNYLICNAGIMFAPRQLTEDNFESHLSVNYLGHCLLIREMLPLLKKTAVDTGKSTRIISVSSSTHHVTRFRFEDILGETDYSSSQAYGQSKLAQIMFNAKLARVLEDTLGGRDVQCFSLHPGVVLSELYEHVKLLRYFPFLIPLIKLVTRNMVEGAETILYAALSPDLDNISGVYLEDCDIKEPSKRSQSVEDQERLWDLTNSLLSKWVSVELDDLKKLT